MLVALTGWGQNKDKTKAFQEGFDHHYIKPVESGDLKELFAKTSRK